MIDPILITPTVDQVASYIRVRTRDLDGEETGTFNADTRPTADQATAIALQAARYVSLKLGNPATEWKGDLIAAATDTAAMYAAWQAETSFHTDGSDQETQLAIQLGQMYSDQLAALLATAQDDQPGAFRIYSIKQTVDPAYTTPCHPVNPCDPRVPPSQACP